MNRRYWTAADVELQNCAAAGLEEFRQSGKEVFGRISLAFVHCDYDAVKAVLACRMQYGKEYLPKRVGVELKCVCMRRIRRLQRWLIAFSISSSRLP